MEAVPIVVFWCVAVWALFRPKQMLLYILFACLPLGSFAVVPTSWVGGFTLIPATALAVLLIVRQLASRRGLTRALDIALQPSAALLMFIFWAIAGITTLFMPRFFSGQGTDATVQTFLFTDDRVDAIVVWNARDVDGSELVIPQGSLRELVVTDFLGVKKTLRPSHGEFTVPFGAGPVYVRLSTNSGTVRKISTRSRVYIQRS